MGLWLGLGLGLGFGLGLGSGFGFGLGLGRALVDDGAELLGRLDDAAHLGRG